MITHATNRHRPLIVTAIFTGMRISELRGLTWACVDFERGVIAVRQRADRLNELVEHARLGWAFVQENPDLLDESRSWLAAHPSGWPEVDELWREYLQGEGPLEDWLASGRDPSEWHGFPSLHSVLASHPFPDLIRWPIQRTSRAS